MAVEFRLQQGDVLRVPSDLLLLKYARSFYGADGAVANVLVDREVCAERDLRPEPWQYALVETRGVVASPHVLFLGTPRIGRFQYDEMRRFARRAIEIVEERIPSATVISTTIHGAGYGLDAEEALQALVSGFRDAMPQQVQTVVFVEHNARRAEDLEKTLRLLSTPATRARPVTSSPTAPAPPPPKKRKVFVAMPFSEDFDDVYQFGIYATVRRSGFVCEKVDVSVLAGDIVERIRDGIREADFVIADLSTERPNVYLEVGYAWGLNRPVIMVARDGTKLHFDLSHHKCIFYKTIGKLAEELERAISRLNQSGDESSGV